ncbi:MAG: NUDIX hydrolase [Pseudomonadota bacterium]
MAQDTPRQIGPWSVRSAQERYSNPWIRIEHSEVVHPDGSDGIYGVVRFANVAVGVLPVFEDGSVLLVGQHRFPLDRYSWELPEGGGPIGADPLVSAKRELLEETGYEAANWLPLIDFDVSNSVTDEVSSCFLAYGLTPGNAEPEPSEELALKCVPFAELFAMCLDGRVRDSLTLVMALTAQARAQRGELPDALARHLICA